MPPSRAASLLLAAGAVLLSGCAGFVPQPGPAVEPVGTRYQWLTTPIVVVGDTQEHESTGHPLHDNDSAIDAYVEVAQRPPEQTLFGRRLLESALMQHPNEPFVHLGDVMDLSCRSEGQRMAQIFNAAKSPGAILPGNHDGLMFGIYAYNLLDIHLDTGASRWNKACQRGANVQDATHKTDNEALSKRGFIRNYIADQQRHQHPESGLIAPAEAGRQRLSWRHPDANAFLSAMEGELLDGFGYADSFLAQRLLLPAAPDAKRRTVLIGLDTNQAGPLASAWDTLMGNSPGSIGHVRPDQIAAISHWVDESVAAGDIVVFAGHHNWNALGLPTRLMLRNLMARLSHPLVYLSAHTHRGFWAEHRVLASQPLLELNVSSLSDWPIAYRRLRFGYDEQHRRLLVQGDLMPRGEAPSASDRDLMAAWENQACKASGVALERLQQEDLALVQQQRASRGSLFQWLLEALGPACERCETPLYEHAQNYQNELLTVLLQTDQDLGPTAHRLHHLPLPAWCAPGDFRACARDLMAQAPTDFKSHVLLFRRKAALVALLNDHLDDLDAPQARAYMSCRAVLAARMDFNATDDARNNHRSEAKRQAEQFFRIEASVGMK
ncbi:MAG: metallophosphoesterase [Hydrogenophaga sp.]|nr:metallophosphoesterase [Hydrogenophaga sp.]